MVSPEERRFRASPADTLSACLELVRLPNLFTAMADVTMGFLFVCDFAPGDGPRLGFLVAASTLLYAGGATLNDYFDHLLDLEERPERPIPSGRISRTAAGWLGVVLLVAGIAAACAAVPLLHVLRPSAPLAETVRPALVALLLAGAIVLYDAWLKRTPLGPETMGACRFLNVLLGMSALAGAWRIEHWAVAVAVGCYITGVTWLARSENRRTARPQIALGLALMMGGIGLVALLPHLTEDPVIRRLAGATQWYQFTALLAVLIGWRSVWALLDPSPSVVRGAVKQAILSLIVLDAAACYAMRDMTGSTMTILLFLLPAIFFGQFFRST